MMYHTQNLGGYLPLQNPDSSSTSDEFPENVYIPQADSNERWLRLNSRITQLVTVTVVICTIVDLLVLLFFTVRSLPPGVLSGVKPTEFRSSYINLDILYSKGNISSSQHGPIVNHALSFVQVSLTEPEKIIPTYHTGSSMEKFGFVPFIERRLLVTPEISTVAQFRAIDFGMESCSLAVGVPSLNQTEGQAMPLPTFTLDVYSLPIRNKLELRTVSYSSLPPTKSLFAQLVLTEDTVVQTPNFPCQSLSYHTFFLACSDPDCHLDLIGTRNDQSGLFMYQYQTI